MSASDKKRLRKEQAAANLTEKQLREQKEAKTLKRHTLTFIVAMILVVAIAFGVVAAQGIDRTGIIQRNTNAVTIGTHTLTSAELNYYYIDAVNSFYSQIYNQYNEQTEMYAKLIYGLDFSTPLNTQMYSYTESWADYFAETAIESAKNIYALYDEAVANNCTLSAEELENFEKSIEETETYATAYYGYSSLKAYLKDVFGYGATEESYREYMRINALASKYYNEYALTLKYEDADLREYEKDHYDEFSSYTYAFFYINNTTFLGEGQKDSNGVYTYTDEQKEAAIKAAENVAETLKKANITTAEQLDKEIAKIEQYKDNEKAISTKYKNHSYSSVNADIVSWVSDSSRKAGDFTVIVDTNTTKDDNGNKIVNVEGHYVVVFESRNDNEQKLVNVRHILEKYQGGKLNSDGTTTYTDKEKAATLAAINTIKFKWLEGKATEESFAELAKSHSDDTGSASNGGLYEDIYPGQMVTAFDDWCFDASRKAGDFEVIETEYGYHLMYFVSYDEMTYRDTLIKDVLFNADVDEWYEGITKKVTATNINTAHLDLDLVISAQ